MFLELVGCDWMFDKGLGNLITEWWGAQFTGKRRVAWRLIPAVILWLVWEQNNRIFEGKLQNSRGYLRKLSRVSLDG